MSQEKLILFDTNVFIHYLRGLPAAQEWMRKVLYEEIVGGINPLVDFELWCRTRNSKEEKQQKILIAKFRRINVHATITRKAGFLAMPYVIKKDKSISIPDFILAASAEYYKADILTANPKHFQPLGLRNVNILSYPVN